MATISTSLNVSSHHHQFLVPSTTTNQTTDDNTTATESNTTTPLPTSFAALKLKFLKSIELNHQSSNKNSTSTQPTTQTTNQNTTTQTSATVNTSISTNDPLYNLIEMVNCHPDHFSTSHCSGRVVVYCAPDTNPQGDGPETQMVELEAIDSDEEYELEGKGQARSRIQNGQSGGEWLFTSSEPIKVPAEEYSVLHMIFGKETPLLSYEDEAPLNDAEDLVESQSAFGLGGIVSFKFESLVLHMTSSSPTASLPFLKAAFSTGHQGSGLVLPNSALASLLHPIPTPASSELLSAKCRSNLAVRTSTMNIDCPIARKIRVPILPQSHTYSSNGPPPPPPPPTSSTAPLPSTKSNSSSNSSTTPPSPPPPPPPPILYKTGYKLLVPPSYLSFLLRQANLRMETNHSRTLALEKAFEKVLREGARGEEWREKLEEVKRARRAKFGIKQLISRDGRGDVERTVGGVRNWLEGIIVE